MGLLMPADTSTGLLLSARDRDDHAAWSRLVSVYTPLLHAWIRRAGMPPHDADDLVQEVLLAVAREMPDFTYDRRKGTFRGWLRTILANRIRDRRRAWRTPLSAEPADDGVLDSLADPHSDMTRAWDAEHDQHVAARLLEGVRHEFGDRIWQSFTRCVMDSERPADVAADLGTSVDAVYQARSRVLARLRREADGLLD
jgi:RNA polymerase sigma-70 factor (ECF subfamily)